MVSVLGYCMSVNVIIYNEGVPVPIANTGAINLSERGKAIDRCMVRRRNVINPVNIGNKITAIEQSMILKVVLLVFI